MGIAFLLILKLMCAEIYDRKKIQRKRLKLTSASGRVY